MTSNELVTLLEIHRRGNPQAIRCGTTDSDIQTLIARKLICRAYISVSGQVTPALKKGNGWMTTEQGHKLIKKILKVCEEKKVKRKIPVLSDGTVDVFQP